MTYSTLVTTLGLAKIAAAVSGGGTLSLDTMKLGDGNGNPVTPSAAQTDLVRTVYTGTLNNLATDPNNANRMIAELLVPANVGGWTVRECGLYDSDGDLIVVANFPELYKPLPGENAARDLLIRIVFEVANPGVIELLVDVNVTIATRQWVLTNFDIAALIPGGTTYQILRKKSNADGDTEWADPLGPTNVTVNVIEETQTLAAAQTIINFAVITTTTGIAVYVEGIRLRNTEWSGTGPTQITLVQSYPAGSKVTIAQNEPTGQLDPLQRLNLLSEIAAQGSGAQATARANLGIVDRSAARAFVHFDGTARTTIEGTYTRSGTTVTVTIANHGFRVGDMVELDFISGLASDADLTVTSVPNTNTFVVTHPTSGNTSGAVRIYRNTVHNAHNVRFVGDLGITNNTAIHDAYGHRIYWETPIPTNPYVVLCTGTVGGNDDLSDDQQPGIVSRSMMKADHCDIAVVDVNQPDILETGRVICAVVFC